MYGPGDAGGGSDEVGKDAYEIFSPAALCNVLAEYDNTTITTETINNAPPPLVSDSAATRGRSYCRGLISYKK